MMNEVNCISVTVPHSTIRQYRAKSWQAVEEGSKLPESSKLDGLKATIEGTQGNA